MKKYFEKFNWITDYARRLDFWFGRALSGIIAGASSMIDFIPTIVGVFLFSFGILCGIIGFFNSLREKKKNSKDISYISLQEAAEFLSKSNFIKNRPRDQIEHSSCINPADPVAQAFWERDNPAKIHKETLPKGTVGLINLTLHMCRKNNVKIYGKRPSFSDYSIINFEEIRYFSSDYTELYPDRSRDKASLIYNNVSIKKENFEYAINNTDETGFDQILSGSLYGSG